ncbi:MAG TPA: Rrf2 family transcriptional regulator [Longimicrobiales bacterium]
MNTRFAVAVHIVTYLACRRGEAATSDVVAESVGTHPALIRRLGAQLARAGIVHAQRGAGGGATLARPAAAITLLDIYRAVDEEELEVIRVHRTANPCCMVGMHMQSVLEQRATAIERAVEAELSRTTIADIVDAVEPARRTPIEA